MGSPLKPSQALEKLRHVVQNSSGVEQREKTPPNQINGFAVVVYSLSGRTELGQKGANGRRVSCSETFRIVAAVPIEHFADQYEKLMPYREIIPERIAAATCREQLGFPVESISHTTGEIDWGGKTLYGHIFDIPDIPFKYLVEV